LMINADQTPYESSATAFIFNKGVFNGKKKESKEKSCHSKRCERS